jgi:predicted ATPase
MSCTVLLHVATTGTAVVAATVRAGVAAPDPVVALWREGVAERIEVGALGRADTERLIADALGGPVDGATWRDLWDASHGNPLVVRELVLGALEVGLLRDDTGLWRLTERLGVPPPLAELLEARLADACGDERSALELLAVGEPLGLTTLAGLSSPEAVDAAERRGLITVSSEGRRRQARLAHPLYGEVLRA